MSDPKRRKGTRSSNRAVASFGTPARSVNASTSGGRERDKWTSERALPCSSTHLHGACHKDQVPGNDCHRDQQQQTLSVHHRRPVNGLDCAQVHTITFNWVKLRMCQWSEGSGVHRKCLTYGLSPQWHTLKASPSQSNKARNRHTGHRLTPHKLANPCLVSPGGGLSITTW